MILPVRFGTPRSHLQLAACTKLFCVLKASLQTYGSSNRLLCPSDEGPNRAVAAQSV